MGDALNNTYELYAALHPKVLNRCIEYILSQGEFIKGMQFIYQCYSSIDVNVNGS